MRTLHFISALILALAFAMPAAATSASSYSGAGQPAAGETAVAGTAIGGASGSGGQTSGSGIDPVRADQHARPSDWAGWIGGAVLLVLIVLAAVRLRYELRRQHAEGRG